MKRWILTAWLFAMLLAFAAFPVSAQSDEEFSPEAEPRMVSSVSAGYNAVTVAWESLPGAQSYELYYKGGNVADWTLVKKNLKGTSFTHRSSRKCPLTAGVRYFYKVKAMAGKVLSPFSKMAEDRQRAGKRSYELCTCGFREISHPAGQDLLLYGSFLDFQRQYLWSVRYQRAICKNSSRRGCDRRAAAQKGPGGGGEDHHF